MTRFTFLKKKSLSLVPEAIGVYALSGKRDIFYIGKSVNIRQRVQSHIKEGNYKDGLFMKKVERIGFAETDSEIEALILEAELIKKYKPRYNVVWRDDKNFFYVGITRQKLPRIFITHQAQKNAGGVKYIGPFVEGAALKNTLRFLRRIFPYYTAKKHPQSLCNWCRIGLCPGPNPEEKTYRENIRRLTAVLKGEKKSVLKKLKKEMEKAGKIQAYEKAAEKRDQMRALESVMAHARVIREFGIARFKKWKKSEEKLKKILKTDKEITRIEAYDISNIQGTHATGSMIVFMKGKPSKDLYRKFRIKFSSTPNDTTMIKEIMKRRFRHQEWPLPEIILIDGGKAQLNAGCSVKKELSLPEDMIVVSLAKRKNELYTENKKSPLPLEKLPSDVSNLIMRLRDEAHRFAISYHKVLRIKEITSRGQSQ